MKKIQLVSAAFCLLLITSCSMHFVRGNGRIVKEDRQLDSFNRVSLSSRGYLSIHQGDDEYVQIEYDQNLLPYVRSQVINGELRLGLERCYLSSMRTIRYKLYVKELASIHISGSADVAADTLISDDLTVSISGSGALVMGRLEADKLTIDVSGSGEATIESGRSIDQVISVSGSGDLDLSNLETRNSHIRISGSGEATVWVNHKMDAKLSGSGDLYYYGNPKINVRTSGSGKVESLGDR